MLLYAPPKGPTSPSLPLPALGALFTGSGKFHGIPAAVHDAHCNDISKILGSSLKLAAPSPMASPGLSLCQTSATLYDPDKPLKLVPRDTHTLPSSGASTWYSLGLLCIPASVC